jgi:hypothetical protein
MRSSTNQAVVYLQFEDLVSQILHKIDTRLSQMQDFYSTYQMRKDKLNQSGADHPETSRRELALIREDLDQFKNRLQQTDHRAVKQEDLSTGRVELF